MFKMRHLFLPSLLFLTGCSSDQNILEKIGYIQSAAYDWAPDNKMKVTLSIPVIERESRDGYDEILTITASSSKAAKNLLSRKTSRTLVSGQLRNLLYGIELAKTGLRRNMDSILRDPSISKRSNIILTEGEAHDIINRDYTGHPKTEQYVDKLLQKEFQLQNTPRILLHQFVRDYFDEGIDPIATVIRISGNDLEVSGIGLFKEDVYVTKLPTKDMIFFNLLYQNQKQGEFSFTLNDEDTKSIMFNAISSKRKIKIRRDEEGVLHADIQMVVHGSVLEYIGKLNLSTDDSAKVEKMMSAYISEHSERVLSFMQKHGVDSIGLGRYVRNELGYAQWKKLDWAEAYPSVQVHVHADFHIKNFGNFFD
ncbi:MULTISPECIES: Ger(x)C family spore germination protein [Paenibacillus]|uniref:Ger(x)C family spore germination protein n=1 Tax=Paenibacillus TaxID=44249 RepID=UPI00020D6D18|nr:MULTISPECIES: Ger(x)C family spore germination protein [Paenibacillus]EGL18748.1 germination protein, Ger(x)C family [Paenibacillus sp. HGF7]EPD92656.1 Ger(X)C family germination protein [Paenibacillus sp. HGH0039]MBV6713225.1 Ger(x)C family spore germination C-terminal domain-containing protein [Paenibacillus chitinolyticus]